MKSILAITLSAFLIYYFVMVIIDSGFWPESTVWKIRNGLFAAAAIYLAYNLASIFLFKQITPEQAFVNRMVDFITNIVSASLRYIQPFRREFFIACIVAALLMFIGLVAIGIPGAFFLDISKWLGLVKGIEGDRAWPSAIFVSLIWPLFIPIGVIIKHELLTRGSLVLAKASIVGTVVFGIVIIVTLTHLFNYLSGKN